MAEENNKTEHNTDEEWRSVGKVVAVQGPVVDVEFSCVEDMPNINETIMTKTFDHNEITMLVAEHLEGNIARCVSLHLNLIVSICFW